MNANDIITAIKDLNRADFKSFIRSTKSGPESTFSAYSAETQHAVEAFYEPGYDYCSADFWSSYDQPDLDFIYAVILYDEQQSKD